LGNRNLIHREYVQFLKQAIKTATANTWTASDMLLR